MSMTWGDYVSYKARAEAAEAELATATTTAELAIRQLEAAEARCARLQQALSEAKKRNSEAQALIDNALWEQRALIREALAGLDTPADTGAAS